ncbi:MAG: LysM peptidoglycan-binding domain-containing protein [Verrucomicrobia bacterium]|nr:LysM peptidoglycan-binding domain-containing protein [Verrucomicrobiota bacterium]
MRFGLLFLLLGFAPLFAQNNQLAGMQQDLAELRNEVEKLKLENADLRDALNKQRNASVGNSSNAEAAARTKAEALAEVDRRLKQQTADVNAALAELGRRVDAALAGRQPTTSRPTPPAKSAGAPPANPGVTPPAGNPPASPDDGLTSEVPRTGTPYRVKSGDTVIRIARQFGSKVEWILQANKLPSTGALRADVEIFVPQPEAPAR